MGEDSRVMVFELSDPLGLFHPAFPIYCHDELAGRDLPAADYCRVRSHICGNLSGSDGFFAYIDWIHLTIAPASED